MRRILRGAMVVFGWFVVPYSRLAIFRTAKRKLPPMTNPLLEIPAIKLADMIRNREVSELIWKMNNKKFINLRMCCLGHK